MYRPTKHVGPLGNNYITVGYCTLDLITSPLIKKNY